MALNKRIMPTRPGDENLVEHVGLVGRDDRDAEHLAKARGEDEKPHERAHERRQEPLALVQVAQHLAPDDAAEAREVPRWPKPAGCGRPHNGGGDDLRPCGVLVLVLAAGSRHLLKAAAYRRRAGRGEKFGHSTGEQDAPLVQQHEAVVGRDLVDEVRRPQHAEALLGDEAAHDLHDALARGDVEADGRLVEQQQARVVQEASVRSRAPRPGRRRGCAPSRRRGPRAARCAAPGRRAPSLAPRDAVQRGVVGEVLGEAQVWLSSVRPWNTTPSRCSATVGLRRTSWPRIRISPVTLS